jgi:hypothetical protein
MIKADVIETSEFPDLAQKYNVIGVPKIVINETVEFVGAFNEDLFAEHVLLGAFLPSQPTPSIISDKLNMS